MPPTLSHLDCPLIFLSKRITNTHRKIEARYKEICKTLTAELTGENGKNSNAECKFLEGQSMSPQEYERQLQKHKETIDKLLANKDYLAAIKEMIFNTPQNPYLVTGDAPMGGIGGAGLGSIKQLLKMHFPSKATEIGRNIPEGKVIFPFEIICPNHEFSSDKVDLMSYLYNLSLYSNISIGNPPQQIKSFIKFDKSGFNIPYNAYNHEESKSYQEFDKNKKINDEIEYTCTFSSDDIKMINIDSYNLSKILLKSENFKLIYNEMYKTTYANVSYINKLSDEEQKLFFILISLVPEIKFTNNEFECTKNMRKKLDYVFKTEEFLKPYYSTNTNNE